MDMSMYLEAVKGSIGALDTAVLTKFADTLAAAYEAEKTVFVIGNGGSGANASHFAQDMSKGIFLNHPTNKPFRALSLTDNTSYITAIANDDGYDKIFSTQLHVFAKPGDLLVCISGSGNSKNIVEAIHYAKQNNIFVVSVTGYDGGILKKEADFSVHVPLNEMCTVESIHSVIFHLIILELRERLTKQPFCGL
jgi:D-sedoheptulose 7-phosphate isomerase